MNSNEVVPLFSGDHEGRQAGSVDGQEDDGEQGPDGGHETGGEGPRAVRVDGNLWVKGYNYHVRCFNHLASRIQQLSS